MSKNPQTSKQGSKAAVNAGGARKSRRELFAGYKPSPEDLAALLEKAERAAVAAKILKTIKKGRGKSKERLDPTKSYARAFKEFHGQKEAERDARMSQPTPEFESAEEFADSIFEKINLQEVALELVKDGGKTKNPTIRIRMLEELLDRKYGKIPPAAREDELPPPRIVLKGLPRPDRKPLQGEES